MHFTKHGLVWECYAVVNFDQPLNSGEPPDLQQVCKKLFLRARTGGGFDKALERPGEAKFFGRALGRWDAFIADFSSRVLIRTACLLS